MPAMDAMTQFLFEERDQLFYPLTRPHTDSRTSILRGIIKVRQGTVGRHAMKTIRETSSSKHNTATDQRSFDRTNYRIIMIKGS